MAKRLAVLVSLVLACLPLNTGRAETLEDETLFMAAVEGVEYVELLPCAEVNFDELLEDEFQSKAAQGVCRWYISEYMYAEDWYRQLWNHTRIVLTEPCVIKVDADEYGNTTIYCYAIIASYALLRGDDGALYFSPTSYVTEWLFRVHLDIFDEIECVENVWDMDEELDPGSGCGTEGFPGMSYELYERFSSQFKDTDGIAQRYLDLNGIDATVVNWH